AAPATAPASCAFVIVWHDRAYFAEGSPETQPHPGEPVQGALATDCADTGGPAAAPTPIAARRIAGVPPGVALLARDTVLVAIGYFPEGPNEMTGTDLYTEQSRV